MKLLKSKKGFLESLGQLAIGVGVAAIVIVVTLLITAEVKSQASTTEGIDYTNATLCATSDICNGTSTAQNEVSGLADWFGLFIIVAIATIILMAIKKIRS